MPNEYTVIHAEDHAAALYAAQLQARIDEIEAGGGAVWTGVYPAMDRTAEVANVLNCPKNIVPVALVRIGYPDESPEPKNKFKEENISYNKFGAKK